MSVEHIVCAEALQMHRELRAARAAAGAAARGRTFRSWLLARGREHINANDEATLSAFLRILRWYHSTLLQLQLTGTTVLVATDLGTVACDATKELLHLAAVPSGGEGTHMLFHSLSHARGRAGAGGSPPARVFVAERWPLLVQLAQDFGALFAQQVRHCLSVARTHLTRILHSSTVCGSILVQCALQRCWGSHWCPLACLLSCPIVAVVCWGQPLVWSTFVYSASDMRCAALQELGAVQPDEWLEAGLTERLRADVQASDGIAACSREDLTVPYEFTPIPLAAPHSVEALAAAGTPAGRRVRLRLRPKRPSSAQAAPDGTSSAESNTLAAAAAPTRRQAVSEAVDREEPSKRRRGCMLPPGVRLVLPPPVILPPTGSSRNAEPPARWTKRLRRSRCGARKLACGAEWCAALRGAPESSMPQGEAAAVGGAPAQQQQHAATPPRSEPQCGAEHSTTGFRAMPLRHCADQRQSRGSAKSPERVSQGHGNVHVPCSGVGHAQAASACVAGSESVVALASCSAAVSAAPEGAARRASTASSHSTLTRAAEHCAEVARCGDSAQAAPLAPELSASDASASGAEHLPSPSDDAPQAALSPLGAFKRGDAACVSAALCRDGALLHSGAPLPSPKRPRRIAQPVTGTVLQQA